MTCEALNNYFNPCSQGQVEAREKFHGLTTMQKVATVVLSTFAWIATIFVVGAGGYAAFKALVEGFSIAEQPATPPAVPDDSKSKNEKPISEMGAKELLQGYQQKDAKEQSSILQALGKALRGLSDAELDELKTYSFLGKEIEQKICFEIKCRLPIDQLLEEGSGLVLDTKKGITAGEGDAVSVEQEAANSALVAKVQKMDREDQIALLQQLKDKPEQFMHVAFVFALADQCVVKSTVEALEALEWPSQALKDNWLPKIVSSAVFNRGIAWDHWDLVELKEQPIRRVFLNPKNILGQGIFTDQSPISMYLAQGIALVIREASKIHKEELELYQVDKEAYVRKVCAKNYKEIEEHKAQMQDERDRGVLATQREMHFNALIKWKEQAIDDARENPYVGIEVKIAQSIETRFGANMFAPLLPYLTGIPGLVSLKLSDVGVASPFEELKSGVTELNGFGDEHKDALLTILRTNPLLVSMMLNVDAMTGTDAFMAQWKEIWRERGILPEAPPQKRTVEDLLLTLSRRRWPHAL